MEELQAQVNRLAARIEALETTQGNQGNTMEEFRTNGNNLQADVQAQLDQMKAQAEQFRTSGNTLQAEMQATVDQMRAQLLAANSSIELLKTNMAHVHGKIDMGLIASHNSMNRDLMESKAIAGLPMFGGGEKESFREWSFKLASVMERLKPGTREILQTIDTTKETEWTSEVHHRNFNSENLKESKSICHDLC